VPVVTIIIGLLLVLLGLWGRFGTESGGQSGTSLIPAFVGLPLALLGLLALKESLLKHAMHAAAMLGLIGLLAAGSRLVVVAGEGKIQSPSGLSTGVMTLLCGVFVALCVNSFIAARRRRKREAVADETA
jgi:hypothetical protein